MKKLLSVFLMLCLVSCQHQEKPAIAFYYWKTIFKLSKSEKAVLSRNHVGKIYLRYFDVSVNPQRSGPFPVGVIQFEEPTKGFEIVPVIYIKNEVMLNPAIDVKDLSGKVSGLINQINISKGISVKEIQIDCDWTLNSRENYLKFIEFFKKENKVTLSTTIRLHQVKYYRETKIPKVDKGVLMYYNMGKIQVDTQNSIYDKKIADQYLKSLQQYPLPLNVALPIFSNGIHIRSNNVIGLKSKIGEQELREDPNFLKIKENIYRAKNGNYKHGIYYQKDDLIKLETVSEANLLEMAADLKENIKTSPEEIIFYDLDELNMANYEKDIFEKISDCF